MQENATSYPRGKYHETPQFKAELAAQTAKIWAQVDAERREQRAKREAFIGPHKRKRMRPLADKAKAHLKAGGCSGDLCRECSGQGWRLEEYEYGKWTDAKCYVCHGSGLGR